MRATARAKGRSLPPSSILSFPSLASGIKRQTDLDEIKVDQGISGDCVDAEQKAKRSKGAVQYQVAFGEPTLSLSLASRWSVVDAS